MFGSSNHMTSYPPICLITPVHKPGTICRHITVTSSWTRWRLKSPASRLFTQVFIQAQIKESTNAPHHLPLCREFTGDRWIPRTKGQWVTRKNASIWWRHHEARIALQSNHGRIVSSRFIWQQRSPQNTHRWNLNQNTTSFIQENAFEPRFRNDVRFIQVSMRLWFSV